MKKKFLLVCMALLTMFGAKAQVPTISTPGNDVWYFIKGMRGPSATALYATASATNSQVLEKDLNYSSAQRWKVVANGDGLALVNKAYGTYLNCDLDDYTQLTTIPTAPTKTLQITASSLLENGVFVENKGAIAQTAYVEPYPVENTFLMHAGGGGDNFGLVNYFDDYSDNASFLFIPVTAADLKQGLTANIAAANSVVTTAKAAGNAGTLISNLELAISNAQTVLDAPASQPEDYDNAGTAIDNAMAKYLPIGNTLIRLKDLYNTSSEGFSPGQFSPNSRSSFKEFIDGIQLVYDNPASTTTEYESAIADVESIINIYRNSVILPEISTGPTDNKWYFIQGDRPVNTYITSQGAGLDLKSATVASSDEQLWRLVANGTGFALQNKASEEYLNPNLTNGGSIVTQTTLPTTSLKATISTLTTNNTYRFWVENTTTATDTELTFLLHAGNSNSILNYKNRNDHTTWLFLDYESLYRNLYIDALKEAQAARTAAVVGDAFGQYTTSKYNAFNEFLTEQEANVVGNMTHDDLINNTAIIQSETAIFKTIDVTPLVSSNPAVTQKWFRIINNATAAYANGKAISSNGRTVDQKFTFETINTASDSTLFRFELNATKSAVLNIINKANGSYLGSDGTMLGTALADNEFKITRLDAVSFAIKPTVAADPLHAAASGLEILNYAGTAGSASSWKIEFVKEETISAVNYPKTENYIIRSNNGVITVDGVQNFEVYSVIGQKQNIKTALRSGVYMVKVNNNVQKYIVK